MSAHPFAAKLWLLGAVFIVYANALLWGAFQFDDYNVIVHNSRIHTWQAWWDDLGHGIRPLLKFTYTLNWTTAWGAASFHLTNIAIHIANVFLVFALSKLFLAQKFVPQPPLTHVLVIPFFTALLFAVHPLHTEAVTYISGRSTSLMTLFYLAGLLAYISGREKNNRWYTLLVTPLLFIAALSVKETAVTFPLALLAWELCFGGKALQKIWRHQWATWLTLLLVIIIFIVSDHYFSQMERSAALNSFTGNIATQTIAFAYLMQQWIFPLWLNIDPDLKQAQDFSGLMPQILFLSAAIFLMFFIFRTRPWVCFAIAWALIQLFPLYVFLPRVDVANDRQMYLVSWPLLLALTIEIAIWLRQKTFVLTLLALAFLLGTLTIQRNQHFYNEIALWQSTAKHSPNKARVRNNLGYAYMLDGQKDAARAEFVAALKINPAYYKARNNLARLDEPR